jgi:hypothetical protein
MNLSISPSPSNMTPLDCTASPLFREVVDIHTAILNLHSGESSFEASQKTLKGRIKTLLSSHHQELQDAAAKHIPLRNQLEKLVLNLTKIGGYELNFEMQRLIHHAEMENDRLIDAWHATSNNFIVYFKMNGRNDQMLSQVSNWLKSSSLILKGDGIDGTKYSQLKMDAVQQKLSLLIEAINKTGGSLSCELLLK